MHGVWSVDCPVKSSAFRNLKSELLWHNHRSCDANATCNFMTSKILQLGPILTSSYIIIISFEIDIVLQI